MCREWRVSCIHLVIGEPEDLRHAEHITSVSLELSIVVMVLLKGNSGVFIT
jgi:hypothetical protein